MYTAMTRIEYLGRLGSKSISKSLSLPPVGRRVVCEHFGERGKGKVREREWEVEGG